MKTAWANILVHEDKKAYKIIVTDGELVDQLPVSRTPIDSLYRMLKEMYDIPPQRIFVTEILSDSDAQDVTTPKN